MTLDEQIAVVDRRLDKLNRRHRDVTRSIERAKEQKAKLLRERDRKEKRENLHQDRVLDQRPPL